MYTIHLWHPKSIEFKFNDNHPISNQCKYLFHRHKSKNYSISFLSSVPNERRKIARLIKDPSIEFSLCQQSEETIQEVLWISFLRGRFFAREDFWKAGFFVGLSWISNPRTRSSFHADLGKGFVRPTLFLPSSQLFRARRSSSSPSLNREFSNGNCIFKGGW